jgi:hypothetical protein
MAREIKIPLLGISTLVSEGATETEIIEAVSEASIAFCINSEEHGRGIIRELELVEEDH